MTSEISIDASNGAVRVGSLSTLTAGMAKATVTDALQPHFESRRDYGNGYEWLYYKDLEFGGKPAGLSVCFHSGVVSQVHLNAIVQASAAEWPTQEESDREIEFVRSILRTMLSRPFAPGPERFDWGLVWSAYDEKGGFASSGLRYES